MAYVCVCACVCVCVCCMLQLFRCFNRLGICQSVTATRRNIDNIGKEANATLKQWKEGMETTKRDEVDVCTEFNMML